MATDTDMALLATHQRVMRVSHLLVDAVAFAQAPDDDERGATLLKAAAALTPEDQGVILHLAGAFGGLSAFDRVEEKEDDDGSD